MIRGIEVGDLKNTGLSRNLNNTITIAADILSNEGIVIDFTPRQIPTIVTELVGISQGMVEGKQDFCTSIPSNKLDVVSNSPNGLWFRCINPSQNKTKMVAELSKHLWASTKGQVHKLNTFFEQPTQQISNSYIVRELLVAEIHLLPS